MTDEILLGKAEWSKLFEPPSFFQKYKYVSSGCTSWNVSELFCDVVAQTDQPLGFNLFCEMFF